MALWCRDLQVVTVPRGETPKPITLVLPFYQNQEFFDTGHLRTWRQDVYRPLRQFVSVIVVDDGSPEPAYLPSLECSRPFPMRLFRIEVDRRWNWLAARNIGAHHASPGWMFLTDMDHVVPEETLRSCVFGRHDPGVIYGFSRREHTGAELAPHPNSWFLTREMFWEVGGYDEALSGHYGTDGDWRRRCAATAPMQILTDHLVRHEFVADSSTTAYLRKQPEDAVVKTLVSARGRTWIPKVLSFPYHQVEVSW